MKKINNIIVFLIKVFKKNYHLVAIAISLFVFLGLVEELLEQGLQTFDSTIYIFISNNISNNMTLFMKTITNFGDFYILIAVILLLFSISYFKRKYLFLSVMATLNLTLCTIIISILKLIFKRTRPDILRLIPISGFSFPSGHSMISISFYGFLIYMIFVSFQSKLKYIVCALLLLLILAIGISRIYLGVHYASDVIAGYSVGFAFTIVSIYITEKIRKERLGSSECEYE